MSLKARKLVDIVMSKTPKTVDTIMDEMFDEIEKNKKAFTTKMIPTIGELSFYLSNNYSKVYIDGISGKPQKNKNKFGVLHYFKE